MSIQDEASIQKHYQDIISNQTQNTEYQNTILFSSFNTPIGQMFICASDQGVCLLEFFDRYKLEVEFKNLQTMLKANVLIGENEHTAQAKQEIQEYFAGQRRQFDVALDTPGTTFQKEAWQQLTQIPFGHTCSYADQAQAIGKPKAVRAVANANSHNRIAIIIPCHRVIGKNGQLTGYAGGLKRKQWLLEHEEKALKQKHPHVAGV